MQRGREKRVSAWRIFWRRVCCVTEKASPERGGGCEADGGVQSHRIRELESMVPEFVDRTGGSQWNRALPGMSFPEIPENRRIRELEFMVPEFVDRMRGSKWQSALPTGSKWVSARPTGSKWVSARPTGSKWQSALPTGSKWVSALPTCLSLPACPQAFHPWPFQAPWAFWWAGGSRRRVRRPAARGCPAGRSATACAPTGRRTRSAAPTR